MSKVTSEQVKKIAGLSKIDLEGEELKDLTNDFNQILDFMKTINEADTHSSEPMAPGDMSVKQPKEYLNQPHLKIQSIQKMAPHFEAGYFVVPRIIENND